YKFPPYSPKSAWCKGFARRFVLANPAKVNEFLWREKKTALGDFRKAYEGTLRMWLAKDLKNLSGPEFAKTLKRKIEESLKADTPMLKRYYPRIGEKDLLIVHINNLVHGHYEFKTTYGRPENAESLLRQPTADCSELGRAGAVLASLFRDDVKIFVFGIDYQTNHGRFESSHCLFATSDYILDPEVNMIIRAGLNEILKIPADKRFERLMESERISLFHNRYLEPARRKAQIETHGTDGGVIVFYYPWYIRGFDRGKSRVTLLDIPKELRFKSGQE
ncbi:MAG: hypothetical protein SVV80_05740, partial [Planctomycetota bacterium]|nr:hypothetical protein [Planctomycetota bacterium]